MHLDKRYYPYHTAALRPLVSAGERGPFPAVADEQAFVEFVLQQGLGPLWHECVASGRVEPPSGQSRQLLHQSRMHAAGEYLLQRTRLGEARAILDDAGVNHAVIKGCHTREVYYREPGLRPATDIDILVAPADKLLATKAFRNAGYSFYGVAENISHECNLVKGNTAIDLHWDILRPGRCRESMVEDILRARTDYGGHWGPGHAATLFLMLVHPVFAKYSTTAHASLVRMVDIVCLLEQQPHCIAETTGLLQRAGLRTAAWLTSSILEALTGCAAAGELAGLLQPDPARRTYLRWWVAANLSARWQRCPAVVQAGYTLPAHDRMGDAWRAVGRARRCRREGARTLADMQAALA